MPARPYPSARPAELSPLRAGETDAAPGFANRAQDDALRKFIPLRHRPLLGEWFPPDPPGCGSFGAAEDPERMGHRPVLCFGPPSVRAIDWTGKDAFGSNGQDATGNALAQLANRSRDELYIVDNLGCGDDYSQNLAELAEILIKFGIQYWAAVGFGVGAWILVDLLTLLSQSPDPRGKAVADGCGQLHLVGFPPPEGRGFPQPKGVSDEDWALAEKICAPRDFVAQGQVIAYHLIGEPSVTREQSFEWFKANPFLQDADAATSGAYPFYAVQGDYGLLQKPWHRTEFFWVLAHSNWGAGPPIEGTPVFLSEEGLQQTWWDHSEAFGNGPARPDTIYNEDEDELLLELRADPNMQPYSNMHGTNGRFYTAEDFCGGNAGSKVGLDIRMFADRTTGTPGVASVGGTTVCTVRFGGLTGISSYPGTSVGVHGGAIEAAMDEVTALCTRVWYSMTSTTRKITHQITKPVLQFQTYKCICKVDSVKNEGAVIIIRGELFNMGGEPVCLSVAEMVNTMALARLKMS